MQIEIQFIYLTENRAIKKKTDYLKAEKWLCLLRNEAIHHSSRQRSRLFPGKEIEVQEYGPIHSRSHTSFMLELNNAFFSLRTQTEPTSHLSFHQHLFLPALSLLWKSPIENKDSFDIYLYFLQRQAQCLVENKY